MARTVDPVFLVAVIGLAAVALKVAARLSLARERRARLEATRAAAAALANALGLAPPRPSALPWREGLWQLDGAVEGCPVRLLVSAGGVEVSVPVEGGAGLDLARAGDFGPGGLVDDPRDPHRPLPDDALGPGWRVRGADGAARVAALAPAALDFLRAPPEGARAAFADGRVVVFVARTDTADAAAWVREVARALRGA